MGLLLLVSSVLHPVSMEGKKYPNFSFAFNRKLLNSSQLGNRSHALVRRERSGEGILEESQRKRKSM